MLWSEYRDLLIEKAKKRFEKVLCDFGPLVVGLSKESIVIGLAMGAKEDVPLVGRPPPESCVREAFDGACRGRRRGAAGVERRG